MEVKKILDEKGIWYRIIDLKKPGMGSSDVEREVSDDVDDIVKTIIMKLGDDFYAFCLLKDQLVDYKKLRDHFQTKKMRMANAEEVHKVAKAPVGGCCPLIAECPVYLAPEVLNTKIVHMGSGDIMKSLEMKTEDLLSLVEHEILDVGISK